MSTAGTKLRTIVFAGIAFIVFGIFILLYKGITYTTREKVVDLGSVEITDKREKTIPLSPLLGAISLAGGIVLVIIGSKSIR